MQWDVAPLATDQAQQVLGSSLTNNATTIAGHASACSTPSPTGDATAEFRSGQRVADGKHGQHESASPATGMHWPPAINGGYFVQVDYEHPVNGSWAWPLSPLSAELPTLRVWPLRRLIRWSPSGQAEALAPNPALLAQLLAEVAQLQVSSLAAPQVSLMPAWSFAQYSDRLKRVLDAIAAGDMYQANLTMPWRGVAQPEQAVAAYLRLRHHAPGGFGAILRANDWACVSHSPECLIMGDQAEMVSLPIKGTRPRYAHHSYRPHDAEVFSQDHETQHLKVDEQQLKADEQQRADLLATAKDQAELTMIVDLVRNDLGRIAEPGGVRVASRAEVIDLPYVHHLVGDVRARLAAAYRQPRHILSAMFPAGSITGAPKRAAMQLLAEIEDGPRASYCGSIGWLGADHAMALSVAIRTATIWRRQLSVHAGGGIVSDSQAPDEWAELHAKAQPMLQAWTQ